ncbi:MAG: hypothetical protein HN742_07900 [Lentisphaerae bacterium]|nr:hypothetical protein [Lentisphaerota bacterium]MBT4817888.1 hypothetical protein [Lentisphaerota bacterium]MBT5604735.1 hypothetical protein [Lentisphaerota bacterium]MBT7058091.1 hypothetical protein [Lentisphaerota bacterium]MBT7841779.1 hypothetical protein [Lentisphaerota bacterium]
MLTIGWLPPGSGRWNRHLVKYLRNTAAYLIRPWTACIVCVGLLLGTAAAQDAPSAATHAQPLVWIFTGLPGDVEHLMRFSETADLIHQTLQTRFGITKNDLRMLFGEGDWGGHEPCTRANFDDEIGRIVEATRSPDARPIWVFFVGHANSNDRDAFFNIGGPDPSARALGKALRKTRTTVPLVLWLTTAASGKFVKHLTGPGRVVVAACADDVEDNETEFPHVLAQAMAAPGTDANADGFVSVLELFVAVKAGLKESYENEDLIQTERPLLDGDGDGQATATPAQTDAAPAGNVRLTITPNQ